MRGTATRADQARDDHAVLRTLTTLARFPRRTVMELMEGQRARARTRTRRLRTGGEGKQGAHQCAEVLLILGDRLPQGCYNNHAQARGGGGRTRPKARYHIRLPRTHLLPILSEKMSLIITERHLAVTTDGQMG